MDSLRLSTELKKHWLIVLTASCFVNANPYAIAITFGTLYVPLLEKFQEDRAKTATVQALLIGLTGSTGVIWGLLCRKFGIWKVMVIGSILISLGYIVASFSKTLSHVICCIGLLSGIGTSIGFVCSSSAIARTFHGKGAGLALAVHNCASGVGIVAYPFLMKFLLKKFGINGTFLILGGLNLNNLLVVLCYYYNVRVSEQSDTFRAVEHLETNKNGWKTAIAWIVRAATRVKRSISRIMNFRLTVIILATSIADGCFNGFLCVILDLFGSKGFSDQESLYLLTVFNVCSIFGRLLPVLSQLTEYIEPISIFILCSILGCAGQTVFLKASELSLVYIGCALSGTAMGGIISGLFVALVHYGHREQFEAAFGLTATFIGVISNIIGPLYGWVRDKSQSYDGVLGVTIGMLGLAALLYLAVACGIKTVLNDSEELTQKEVEVG